ncbi:hypothetical protein R4315_28355, partial [Rhodococcus oxybenzonivorans]|nr:hypothetical protein [Rhodococcus oxybenzonivorans]
SSTRTPVMRSNDSDTSRLLSDDRLESVLLMVLDELPGVLVTLLLIQCSPAHEELERIAEQVFPLVPTREYLLTTGG